MNRVEDGFGLRTDVKRSGEENDPYYRGKLVEDFPRPREILKRFYMKSRIWVSP